MLCLLINGLYIINLIKGGFKLYILIDCILNKCLNLKKMLWEDSFIVLILFRIFGGKGFMIEIVLVVNVICWFCFMFI